MSRRPQVSGLADQSHLTRLTGLPLSPALLFYCSPALVGLRPTRPRLSEFEQVPVDFFLWFLEPSLQRGLVQELMRDLAGVQEGAGRSAVHA